MKKLINNDNFLKFISLLIAIAMWLFIIVVNDPVTEATVRDIPIQFVGEEILHNNGFAIVSESATSVTVKVKGSRKRMGNYNMDSVIARVDVSGITSTGNNSLPVEVVVPFENIGISTQEPYTVDIKTDVYEEKELPVEVERTRKLATDYIAGDLVVEPKNVKISGPKSVLEKIAKAKAVLELSDQDVDFDTTAPIKFYDVEGKEILSRDAISNVVDKSTEMVRITCPVLKIKEVYVEAQFNYPELLGTTEYAIEPEKIYIYSDQLDYTKIISVQTEPIAAEKLLESKKVKAKLLLPENVKVIDDVSEVEVSLK